MAFRIWRAIANAALKLVDLCICRMERIKDAEMR